MTGDDRVCTSVRIERELNDAVESELQYGESKNDWIIEAVEQRLEREADVHGDETAELSVKQ